tara:strand:+ start:782 stop:1009 length:228 start_codon:yes stop_codon:yes gene_type:complete
MGRMSYISHLCETKNIKELIKEVNTPELTGLTSKTPKEIAIGFIEAHHKIKDNKKDNAYKVLNKIHEELKKESHD